MDLNFMLLNLFVLHYTHKIYKCKCLKILFLKFDLLQLITCKFEEIGKTKKSNLLLDDRPKTRWIINEENNKEGNLKADRE